MKYKFYVWLMGVTGTISAWAWRKHVKILEAKRGGRNKKTYTRFDDLE